MSHLLLLNRDARVSAKLAEGVGRSYHLHSVGDLPSFYHHLRALQPMACIVDLLDGPFQLSSNALRDARRSHPQVAFVVASDFRGREKALFRLGEEGIDGVIRLETDPAPRVILGILDRAVARSLASRTLQAAAEDWVTPVRAALRWTIEHADDKPQVSDLAKALALSPPSLRRILRRWKAGTPRELLLWGRLIRATHLLEQTAETAESVAFRLGYSTGGSLGRALKQHVGCSPTQLRRRGGLTWTLEALRLQGPGSSNP